MRSLLIDPAAPDAAMPRPLTASPSPGVQKLEGLQYRGIDENLGVLHMCKPCGEHLRRGQLPKFAVPNGFLIGELPEALRGLTWAEQRVIAKCGASVHVLHLRSTDRVGGVDEVKYFTPKLKGHFTSLPQVCVRICLL